MAHRGRGVAQFRAPPRIEQEWKRQVVQMATPMRDQVVERVPYAAEGGRSGALLERVRLTDGRRLVVKRSGASSDFVNRVTGDDGRLSRLWDAGAFDLLPSDVDTAVVAVERDGDEEIVYMRDVSNALLEDDRVLTRQENLRVLYAVDGVHRTLSNAALAGLCPVDRRVAVLSPTTMEACPPDNPLVPLVLRGWEHFFAHVPADVAAVVRAVHVRPWEFATRVASCPDVLIHGDLRLANVGLLPDRVILLDWGALTGWAPAEMEFAWYLALSASRIDATREQFLDDLVAVRGERFDTTAWDLGCIAALAMLGWNKALDSAEHADPAVRARESADLDWWLQRVREATSTWSPG